jgi:hypothetical protein
MYCHKNSRDSRSEIIKVFCSQIVMVATHYGMKSAQMCYEFTLENKSQIWFLPGLIQEARYLHTKYTALLNRYGEMLQFGRILDLMGISDLDVKNFPRLNAAMMVEKGL